MGAKNASESFNRFVEGGPGGPGGPNSAQYRQVPIDESKREFWDDFASLADQRNSQGSSAIGTAAMGKGARGAAPSKTQKQQDDWDDW